MDITSTDLQDLFFHAAKVYSALETFQVSIEDVDPEYCMHAIDRIADMSYLLQIYADLVTEYYNYLTSPEALGDKGGEEGQPPAKLTEAYSKREASLLKLRRK